MKSLDVPRVARGVCPNLDDVRLEQIFGGGMIAVIILMYVTVAMQDR